MVQGKGSRTFSEADCLGLNLKHSDVAMLPATSFFSVLFALAFPGIYIQEKILNVCCRHAILAEKQGQKEALEIIEMDLVHLGKANADLFGG